MKKIYSTPLCENITLPAGRLCTNPTSVKVSGDPADEGGFSKQFWGVIDDDSEEEVFEIEY